MAAVPKTDPSYDTQALKALDHAHHLHPFTDHEALWKSGGSRIFTHGEGVHIYDSEGKRLLDGMAGLWCVMVGYGRRELADAAARQMMELPFYNSFFKCTTVPPIELAARIAAIAPKGISPSKSAKVMFGNSGSEAVDSAVRMVRHFWALEGKPDKQIVIGRKYGYHGSTIVGCSVGGMSPMHKQAGNLPGFSHIMPPYWYAEGGDMSPEAFGLHAARQLETRIKELGADKVAAFFAEPIQGAGGVIVPPDSYWPEIQRICRAHNILLVADEVICGFGRLGAWWGSDHFNIAPDLMTFAKGVTSGYIPLSGIIVGNRVADTLIHKGEEFYHGFTYSGHPVACAVALANLDIIEREKLTERTANDTGPYLAGKLHDAFADHPLVGEVRSIGLIGAIELVEDRQARRFYPDAANIGLKCRDHCFREGLVMRAVRDTMVLAPPLTITRSEIDDLVRLARHCVDLTAKELGKL